MPADHDGHKTVRELKEDRIAEILFCLSHLYSIRREIEHKEEKLNIELDRMRDHVKQLKKEGK